MKEELEKKVSPVARSTRDRIYLAAKGRDDPWQAVAMPTLCLSNQSPAQLGWTVGFHCPLGEESTRQ